MHHRSSARKKRKTSSSKPVSPDFRTRMRLLGFTRGDKAQFLALMEQMEHIEKDLDLLRQRLRQSSPMDEEMLSAHIRVLEDQRFLLMSQLYGNRVGFYQRSS